MTAELDLRSIHPSLYRTGAKAPVLVSVPDLTVLAIDGVGDPAVSPEYQASVEVLMAMAWGVRALRKEQEPSRVIKVMPLEGSWTLPGIMFSEDPEVRAQLRYSMQVVQPDGLRDEVEAVRERVRAKKRDLARVEDVRLERARGGPAATLLHVGPYATEPATIRRIHEAIEASGGEAEWGHRKIYLSDPRRTAPEKLKTILRVSIRR